MWGMAHTGVLQEVVSGDFWGDSGGLPVVPYVGVGDVLSSNEILQPWTPQSFGM